MIIRTCKRILAILTAAVLALALCAPALAERITVYAARDNAKVYDSAGNVVGTLPANTELTLTGVKGKVCRVEKDGKTAYMNKADLRDAPETSAASASDASKTEKGVSAYVNKEGATVYNAKGKATGTLALNTAVTVTATKKGVCRITSDGHTGYMNSADLSATKTATPKAQNAASPARGTAREMDWWTSDIQTIFARGVTARITDVETGLTWQEKRTGGTNHADCQPLTAADTAAMKQAYGGTWSWNRRAVFVTINGVNYAASINGMPHGSGSITNNNFGGHHCIHFTNSRTHGSNKVCSLHQAAIKKAAAARL